MIQCHVAILSHDLICFFRCITYHTEVCEFRSVKAAKAIDVDLILRKDLSYFLKTSRVFSTKQCSVLTIIYSSFLYSFSLPKGGVLLHFPGLFQCLTAACPEKGTQKENDLRVSPAAHSNHVLYLRVKAQRFQSLNSSISISYTHKMSITN